MKSVFKSETGIAHIGAVVLIALVLVGVGGAGYTVYTKNQSKADTSTLSSTGDSQSSDDTANPDDSPENDQIQIED